MKKIFVTLMSLIIIGSLVYSGFIASSMYDKYNETIEWKNSSLLSSIHQVPPSLAKNYVTIEEQRLFQILTDVNVALEEIKSDGEVKEEKYNDYWDLHELAKEEIEGSDIYESLPIKDIFNDFSLYLEADIAIKKAYTELNVEDLNEYEKIFSERLTKEHNDIEEHFINNLRKISNDYRELDKFAKSAIERLGIIENNVLHVGIRVNKSITDDLLKEIADKKLTKFAHIKDLSDTLSGSLWRNILAHNSSSLEYYSWKESEEILDSLLRSNYVSISSFKTVQDVLSYDPSFPLNTIENFTIEKDSPVLTVHHNGKVVSDDMYIKRGVTLDFVIDYEYTENPKSTVVVKYVDVNGLQIAGDESHTGYVGNPININEMNIEGYVLVEIDNELEEFPEEDSVIHVIYEEHVEEVIEEEEEENNSDDSESDDEENENEDENSDDEEDLDNEETEDSDNNSDENGISENNGN